MFTVPVQLKNLSLFLIKLISCLFFYIQSGRTPLLSACAKCLSDVAQLLINKGASIDVTDIVSQCNKSNSNVTNKLFFLFMCN